MTRKEILSELRRELSMRKKVWRGIATADGTKFPNIEHQRQFDTLAYNEAIIDTMTDAEFAIIKARLERVIAAMEAQQSLF